MNTTIKSISILFTLLLMACGGKEEKKKEGFSVDRQKTEKTELESNTSTTDQVPASERVDLTNKGIGPIESVTLDSEVDQVLAAKGKEVYDQMCFACHRPEKRFIGPAPKDILERRSPEWVMNMILNPEEMLKKDPLAKDLLQEFNGAPMADQGLTEEQARNILEYFRTL